MNYEGRIEGRKQREGEKESETLQAEVSVSDI